MDKSYLFIKIKENKVKEKQMEREATTYLYDEPEVMSLLKNLWGNAGGDGGGGGKAAVVSSGFPEPASVGDAQCMKTGMSYAQVATSSSSDEDLPSKCLEARGGGSLIQPPLAGAKRPRSPVETPCGRCFRTTHKTAECHHQIVCLRCSCVGHMAA